MNATVKEWVAKAEGDYLTAIRESKVSDSPNFDAVCFHAQQCAEKLMKAILIDLGKVPPRTHDLTELDRLLTKICPQWAWPAQELRFLSHAAVNVRYPGDSTDLQDAKESLDIAARLRLELRTLLGVPA